VTAEPQNHTAEQTRRNILSCVFAPVSPRRGIRRFYAALLLLSAVFVHSSSGGKLEAENIVAMRGRKIEGDVGFSIPNNSPTPNVV